MQHRFFAAIATTVLLFQTVGLAATDTRRAKTKNRAARLVAMLPASDGVAVFDAKRFFDPHDCQGIRFCDVRADEEDGFGFGEVFPIIRRSP